MDLPIACDFRVFGYLLRCGAPQFYSKRLEKELRRVLTRHLGWEMNLTSLVLLRLWLSTAPMQRALTGLLSFCAL